MKLAAASHLDFAVDEDVAVGKNGLRVTAGFNQIGVLQKLAETDHFAFDFYLGNVVVHV